MTKSSETDAGTRNSQQGETEEAPAGNTVSFFIVCSRKCRAVVVGTRSHPLFCAVAYLIVRCRDHVDPYLNLILPKFL